MADLTKNQSLVLTQLRSAEAPQSAYNLLDQLRDKGLRAPLQIYRALESLQASGLVHRLESLNAYMACNHASCSSHKIMAFVICEDCAKVTEIADESLSQSIQQLGVTSHFKLRSSIVELRGQCADCAA